RRRRTRSSTSSSGRISKLSGGTPARSRPTTYARRSWIPRESPPLRSGQARCFPAVATGMASAGRIVPGGLGYLRPPGTIELAAYGVDLRGKRVADVGAGEGRLALGAPAQGIGARCDHRDDRKPASHGHGRPDVRPRGRGRAGPGPLPVTPTRSALACDPLRGPARAAGLSGRPSALFASRSLARAALAARRPAFRRARGRFRGARAAITVRRRYSL